MALNDLKYKLRNWLLTKSRINTPAKGNSSITVYFPKEYRPNENYVFQDEVFLAPYVEIEGIVSEESQAGLYPPENQDEWMMHVFFLAAWKTAGETALRSSELRLLRPVRSDTKYTSDMPAYSAVKLRVAFRNDQTSAFMDAGEWMDPQQPPFKEAIADLSKPVSIETRLFGTLVLDKSVGRFEGNGIWKNQSVDLNFTEKNNKVPAVSLTAAEQLWADQEHWDNRMKDHAVHELLNLKNEYWREDDDAEVDAETFRNSMVLESISFEADGNFTFYHTDGDLFYGHYIAISGNLEEGPNYADIPG